jgi:predicted lipoprotein with Yx(FWY)xxD motif
MIALNLPNPLMAITGPSNEVELEFTIETTEDLQNWTVNERIQRTLQGGVGKYFLRIQTGAPYVQPTVLIHEHPTLGDILTDANGQVYYFFLYDSEGGTPVANSSWPVATAAGTPVADVGITAALGVNGDKLTINNFPVYTYVGDTEANQASGHNLGSVWFTIQPNGDMIF